MIADDPGSFGLMGPAPRPGGRPGFTAIRPELLVGEYPTPTDIAWLRDVHRVTAVVSLQDDGDLASKGLRLPELQRAYAAHGVAFHRFAVPDGDGQFLAARLGDILAAVDRVVADGGRVYLHCNAGFNRAPTAAIAWLHVREGLSLAEARDTVKALRPCVPYMRALELFFATRR
jgi:predicted protein tyrosine phosphatase